jgi:hypothetical protein
MCPIFLRFFFSTWGGWGGRYGRGGLPARPVRQGKKSGSAGGLSRADPYSRQFLTMRSNRPVRQGKQDGQYRGAQGQVGMGGGKGCTYIITS